MQNGKIKNKVLKLEATILKLKAQEAQGADVADKLADEQKKLDNNIALDKAAAGQASTFLSFDAQVSGAGPALGAAAATGGNGAAATGGKGKNTKGARAIEAEEDDVEDEADEVEDDADDVEDDADEIDDEADDDDDEQ